VAVVTDLPMLTLPQMLRHHAQTTPDRVALRQKDFGIWQPITWREYFRRASAFGLGLAALGVRPGDRVAVLSDNCAEWVIAQLGAGLVGAVTVGVYPTSPANEVDYVLAHSGATVVIAEDQEQTDKVLACHAARPHLRRIIAIETKGLADYPQDVVMPFRDLLALGEAQHSTALIEETLAAQTLDDLALTVYTSGSTGLPKGALLTYRNLRAQADAAIDRLGLDADTSHLSYLPLCHVAEQIFSTMAHLYSGSLVSFGESLRTVQSDLREVAPTSFLGVPRIWEKLHSAIHTGLAQAGGAREKLFEHAYAACERFAEKAPAQRTARESLTFALWDALVFRALRRFIGLGQARVVMTGAAPIPAATVRFFRTLGLPLVEVYGATETSGMATGQHQHARLPGCVGPPAKGVELRIGDAGEILVRGEVVFAGYHADEAATAAAFTNGWYRTGDVGVMVEGQLRIVDRLKDVLITAGGKNLSPSEIENTVKASPYIKECIVLGEARHYIAALIQIEADSVSTWAESRRIAFTTFRSLAEHNEVRALIDTEVRKANAQLPPVAQIKRFHLLTKELDHDDGEVTATMKVRRASIQKVYAREIEGLYA
jgi:long-chain acyl-CoA synthetase